MVVKRQCSFCAGEIEPGTGIMFVKRDGAVFHFCSGSCRKQQMGLGRVGHRVRWTRAHALKRELATAAPHPSAAAPAAERRAPAAAPSAPAPAPAAAPATPAPLPLRSRERGARRSGLRPEGQGPRGARRSRAPTGPPRRFEPRRARAGGASLRERGLWPR